MMFCVARIQYYTVLFQIISLVTKGKQTNRKIRRRRMDGGDFRRSLGQLVNSTGVPQAGLVLSDEDDGSLTIGKELVSLASRHQGVSTPFLFHYPGQQCGAIALIALLYSTVHPVGGWRITDLDKILIVGDRLHFLQVCCLRFKVEGTQKLTVDELATSLLAFNYEFTLKTKVVAGTTSQSVIETGLLELQKVLEDCVKNNSVGVVLRFLDYCVACINNYGEWFLFDSHARDSRGMVDGEGKAVLIKFFNSAAVAAHVNEFQMRHGDDIAFEALVLEKMQRTMSTHRDEMRVSVVPPVVLVKYKSKYGNVQVDSDNLMNLEHGYLIDDNLVDFVLFHKAEEKSTDTTFPANTLFIFSACFYKKLTAFNPNRIRNWTKGVNIFQKDFVVMPVCTGSHWILIILKMNHGTDVLMTILDSANKSPQTPGVTRRLFVERFVKNYLKDEWAAKTRHLQKTQNLSFENVCYPDVPQQPNQTDCGVYVMQFFAEFLKNIPIGQWRHWTPSFSHHTVMQMRTDTMFLIQELASKE